MHQYIDGGYRDGRGERAERVNPATGEAAETIRYASAADVGDAVAAAKAALPAWASATPAERSVG